MDDVKRDFETYVDEWQAQLGAAKVAGSVGDDDQEEIDALINDYRTKIEAAGPSEARARSVLEDFKRETERYGQGTGV